MSSDVSVTTAGSRRWDPDISGAAFIADDGSIDLTRPFWDPAAGDLDPAAAARAIAAAIRASRPAPGTSTTR